MLSLFSAATNGHVRMLYTDMSIRNANSATADGQGSVNGACGSNAAWGSNGQGVIQDGARVSLKINYAAGHNSPQNRFRMAMSCGATTPNDLAATAAELTTATHLCEGTGGGGGYPVDASNAIVDGGYTLTCTLPEMIGNAGADGSLTDEATECTISLVDQRDWGGCVDFTLSAAEVIPPPPAPPTPSPAGYYMLQPYLAIDSSAATFACCNFTTGLIAVPTYNALSDSEVEISLDGRLENCRTNSDITDCADQVAGDYTSNGGCQYDDVYVYKELKIKLQNAAGTSKYSGSVDLAGQPFQFDLENGVVSYYNTGADQPIFCDGYTDADTENGYYAVTPTEANRPVLALNEETATQGNLTTGSSGGDATVAVVVVVLLLVAIGGGYFYCKSKGKSGGAPPPPPGKQAQLTTAMPPPPPGPPGSTPLPPGWQMAVDPNTGHPYYVNAATGASQWTPPDQFA